jgi:glycosyltransferase involved in cell wall biosynthesis
LVPEIDKNDIIFISNINEIIDVVKNIMYDYVIVNKLDEFLNVVDKLDLPNTKKMFITHNSMDPVNKAIIEKSKYLDKVMTVNFEHINLFYENKINCIADNFTNHIEIKNKVNYRKDFKYKIVFIGRVSKEKNVDLLIDAFNLFSKNKPNVNLTIIGDGKLTIKRNKNINFLGRCDKKTIEFTLVNCDYLILPSSTEGLPFVFLEAMNLGIPAISSNIVGLNEMIIENKTGFMFDIVDYDKYKNNLYTWDILEHFEKNKDKIILSLVECFKKAYSINIEQWNIMSENCHDLIKFNYEEKSSAQKNLNLIKYNPYAFISNCKNVKYIIFDFYNIDDNFNYDDYKLVLKFDLEKINNIDPNIIYTYINNIYSEMISNKIKKIIDKYNNFIISNSNFDAIKIIDNIENIFLF